MTFNELLRDSYRTHPRLSYPERAAWVRAQLSPEIVPTQGKAEPVISETHEDQPKDLEWWRRILKGKEE